MGGGGVGVVEEGISKLDKRFSFYLTNTNMNKVFKRDTSNHFYETIDQLNKNIRKSNAVMYCSKGELGGYFVV